MNQELQELRTQLVQAHERVFDGLLDSVAGLEQAAWSTRTGCPGWSVHDQLAHVIGIERAMLGDDPDDVDVPDLPHLRNDFGWAVEVAVQARRVRSSDDLLEEARETFARRLAALQNLDPAALQGPLDGAAGMRMKGSQMLRTRVFDMVSHEHDIRRALGRPGDVTGPHVDIAVEQVLRAWAKLLPQRLHGGQVLEVVVEGRDPVRIDLSDGQLHRGGQGPDPTATLHLDVSGLLALAGGRTDAPEGDELRLEGDPQLGAEVLRAATITP